MPFRRERSFGPGFYAGSQKGVLFSPLPAESRPSPGKPSGARAGASWQLLPQSPEKSGFPGFAAHWDGLFPARDGRAGILTNVPAPTYNIFNSEHC